VYYNADVQKSQILSENKNKSGISRFTNFINGKTYIGSLIGFRHSEETKAKMSTARQGDKHPLFGTSHSEEIKAKISNGMKA